jgi:chemotaxis protein MotA
VPRRRDDGCRRTPIPAGTDAASVPPVRVASLLRLALATGRSRAVVAGVVVATGAAGFAGLLAPGSLLVTVGGALAVGRLTFSRERLEDTWRQVTAALAPPPDADALVVVLKRLARIHRVDGTPALERALPTIADPAVRRAIEVALECPDADEVADVLFAEARGRLADGEAARHVVVTFAKLFPAFGLIGTLLGLAFMLRNLATADLAAIAPGLGLAVLTTLYGAVLANVVALPLAAKLDAHLAAERLRSAMIAEGVTLVHRREYPTRVERVLRAHLGAAPDARRPVLRLSDAA